jgi:hypothetical protein
MDLERRYVQPFYMTMMWLNALRCEVPFDALRDAARQVTDYDVTLLLNSDWRPRVMGAWFASGRAGRLETALLRSLGTSGGSLTAPALATVAVRELGAKAVPSLQAYLQCDLEHEWGSASFVAAALERLGAVQAAVAVNDRDRGDLEQMLIVARRLAGGSQPDHR